METIKSYTDLEQSRKLAEILPLESADMEYLTIKENGLLVAKVPFVKDDSEVEDSAYSHIYDRIVCWSLAALLGVLPKEINIEEQCYAPCLFPVQDKWLLKLWYNSNYTITSPIAIFSDNPVDACVAMIEKLHELNLL